MTDQAAADAAALEALRLLGPAPENWAPIPEGVDHNVLVVGAGQSGAAIAFALARAGVGGVSVIDAENSAAATGVWRTTARMLKLRTPKSLPGPELGLPALSFQAWREARHGREAYAAIDRIARTDWADYLAWHARVTGFAPRRGVRLDRIEPAGGAFRLHLETDAGGHVETARKIVLANGFLGAGGPFTPHELRGLPPDRLAHTSDAIDFAALKGRRVAVIGGAASAFDAAGAALEAGAADVRLFVRRPALANLPVSRARAYPGAYDNYPALPDALKWRTALWFRRAGSTTTTDAIERLLAFPNARLHLGLTLRAASETADGVALDFGGERHFADVVIAGTGYVAEPGLRPELRDFAGDILRWRDVYEPPAGEEDAGLGAHPYLGPGHAYRGRTPEASAFLRHIHVFNPSAFVSYGLPVGDVPSVKRDVPGVVAQISRDLFLADLDAHAARIAGEVPPDFEPSLYAPLLGSRSGVLAAE
ncbi:NAD(P)-binding domain-containing protein [Methylopila henanensis]|uniref:NAD(P)-binding domain-containing protein n=1 Tax=Methylopila henanensis TaxID=873516 RepID=A0ABW4K7Y9_9HYPH